MKLLLILAIALVLSACTGVPYRAEFDAYVGYVQSEVSSGRVSLTQGQYLIAAKENELRARSGAAINAGIANAYPGAALAAQGAQRTRPGSTCMQTGSIIVCQ